MSANTPDQAIQPIQLSAMLAGAATFIVVYAAGLVAILLVSILLRSSAAYEPLMLAIRIGGWIALGLPAWVAVRVANHTGWRYGALFGLLQGLTVMVLMTLSFSWDGTLRAEVMASLLPAFALVFCSALLGNALGSWQNRHLANQRRSDQVWTRQMGV